MISIPSTYEALDPDWFTAVLRQHAELSEAKVSGIRCDRSIHQGFFSDITRVYLGYAKPVPQAPASLIVKLSSRNPDIRNREPTRASYRRETGFYRTLQPLIDLPTPRCFHAAIDPESIFHVLVLEDLAPAKTGSAKHGCTQSQAELAIQKIAVVHAGWWQRSVADYPWLGVPPVIDALELASLHDSWWPKFLKLAGHQLNPEMIELGKKLGRHRAGIMTALFVSEPKTLIHRDYSVNNMMFASDEGGAPLTVFDWQSLTMGRGVWDIAWFIGQSLTIEHCRTGRSVLLAQYYNGLIAGGVTGYSFDDCQKDFSLALLQRFGSLISSIADLPFSARQKQLLIDVFVPRNAAAIMATQAHNLLLN